MVLRTLGRGYSIFFEQLKTNKNCKIFHIALFGMSYNKILLYARVWYQLLKISTVPKSVPIK